MTPEDNKAFISRFVEEILNNKNLEAIAEFVVEDFIELDPLPGQQQGREGLKQVIGMMVTAFPDMHWSIHEQIAEGEKVVSRFTWNGTHQGEFFGVPATGKSVAVKGVVIDRVVAGKLQDSRILMDTMGMMQQLGVIPSA